MTSLYAASVIHCQLPYNAEAIDAVLDQLGPVGESDNNIALYDFFAVRAELARRHGEIQATAGEDEECVFIRDAEEIEAELEALEDRIHAALERLHSYQE